MAYYKLLGVKFKLYFHNLVKSDDKKLCQLPRNSGRYCTKTPEKRWYFDTKFRACIEFDFKGCDGNYNNFKDQLTCENLCESTVSVLDTLDIRSRMI